MDHTVTKEKGDISERRKQGGKRKRKDDGRTRRGNGVKGERGGGATPTGRTGRWPAGIGWMCFNCRGYGHTAKDAVCESTGAATM